MFEPTLEWGCSDHLWCCFQKIKNKCMAVLYSQPTRPSVFTYEQDQTLFKLKGLWYNSQYACKIYYKGNNVTKTAVAAMLSKPESY